MSIVFFLKEINIEKLNNIYKIPNLNIPKLVNEGTTDIFRLITPPKTFLFTDNNHSQHKFDMLIPNLLNVKCFWCRNYFDWNYVGCPIEYVSAKVSKSYKSKISNLKYSIIENITPKKFVLENNDDVKIEGNSYYVIDGVFCSFNCCKSFVIDNKMTPVYKDSLKLLNKLYYDIYNKKNKYFQSPTLETVKGIWRRFNNKRI